MLNVKIVILVAIGLGSAASSGMDCDPGDMWKEECNTCICTQRGVPKCTAHNCHPDAYHVTSSLSTLCQCGCSQVGCWPAEDGVAWRKPYRYPFLTVSRCKPFSRWRVDCNYCECSEIGAVTCTNNICDANELTSYRFKREAEPTLPSRDACKPGVAWKDDCNRCFCRESGKAECTKLLCFPLDMPERRRRGVEEERASWKNAFDYDGQPEHNLGSQKTKQECTPGSSWWDEASCNHCVCSQKGVRLCTNSFNVDCIEKQQDRARTQYYFTPSHLNQLPIGFKYSGHELGQPRLRRMACTEGQTWKEECNRCYCTQEGIPACTKKLCLTEETSEKRQERAAICTEGDTWKEGCNNCFCSKDGTPACTRKLCDPEEMASQKRSRRQTKCKPGETWREDCNTCHCNKEGEVACTLKGCPSETQNLQIKTKREVKRCTPGKKWKDDCNDCTCTHTGYPACTLKACASQTYIVPDRKTREVKRCEPGKKWKDDCNDCTCTHTGYPACTLKACASQTYIVPDRKTREVKRCEPGKKWKDDCNDCTCTHTGYPACTLKACASQTYIVPDRKTREVKRCEPGKKWKDDCNDCTCTHTGYPACTLKACASQTYIVPDRKIREVKKCQPGTKWKDDCNSCVCTHTGYASCTLKACSSQTHILPTKQKRQIQQSDKECEPGTSWMDDCNFCFCSDAGQIGCTMKGCSEKHSVMYPIKTQAKLKRQIQSCTPGSKWQEGCNNCHCLANGTAACTRRLCRRRRDTGQDARDIVISLILPGYPSYPECRPAAKMCGSTSSASESQTRKRDGGKLRGRGRCTPGSTWIQNCSQCYCDEQNNVECVPEESCSEDQATSQGRNKEEGPKGRGRCEAGSTWEIASRRGDWCNLCACDANGIMNCVIRPCQKIENMSRLESETRTKRATVTSKKTERWCKPGDMYYFTCDVCPCGLKGITGCNSRTCRDRAL